MFTKLRILCVGTLLAAAFFVYYSLSIRHRQEEIKFMLVVKGDYFPDYFRDKHSWPSDLNGIRSYILGKEPGASSTNDDMYGLALKAVDDLKPSLLTYESGNDDFEGRIDFETWPHDSLRLTVPVKLAAGQ